MEEVASWSTHDHHYTAVHILSIHSVPTVLVAVRIHPKLLLQYIYKYMQKFIYENILQSGRISCTCNLNTMIVTLTYCSLAGLAVPVTLMQ